MLFYIRRSAMILMMMIISTKPLPAHHLDVLNCLWWWTVRQGSIRPGPNVSSRGAQKYHAQRGGGGAGSPSLSPGGAGAAGGGAGGGDCELMGLFFHKKVLVFILERAIKKLRAWAGMYLCMYYTYVCTYVCVYSYKETHSTMTFP